MRIAAADIALESASQSSSYREVREELTEGYVRAGEAFNKENLVAGSHRERVEREALTVVKEEKTTYSDIRQLIAKQDAGKYTLDQLMTKATGSSHSLFELSPEDKLKIEMLIRIFESLTGKRFNVGMMNTPDVGINASTGTDPATLSDSSALTLSSGEGALEYGLEYSFEETVVHQEQSGFQASGQVRTTDGKVIDLNLQLNLSRSSREHSSLFIRLGAALKDPLVINFNGTAAELSSDTLTFDIDMDGDQEQIHRLAESSGYLALDKDNNGEIDHGGELFGAITGNGFDELAQYDNDNNGFIDEADDIWGSLKIWVQHSDGSSSLFTLADKNIGALYLGYTSTDWELTAGDNSDEIAGKVRATGLFLDESGQAGTLQQIDLVV